MAVEMAEVVVSYEVRELLKLLEDLITLLRDDAYNLTIEQIDLETSSSGMIISAQVVEELIANFIIDLNLAVEAFSVLAIRDRVVRRTDSLLSCEDPGLRVCLSCRNGARVDINFYGGLRQIDSSNLFRESVTSAMRGLGHASDSELLANKTLNLGITYKRGVLERNFWLYINPTKKLLSYRLKTSNDKIEMSSVAVSNALLQHIVNIFVERIRSTISPLLSLRTRGLPPS